MSPAQSKSLRQQLELHLVERDIQQGFSLLDQAFAAGEQLDPASPDGIPLLFCLAQWVELGYPRPDVLDRQLPAFAPLDRLNLPFVNVVQLQMVDAFRLMGRRLFSEAASLLAGVLLAGEGLLPPDLLFVARFWSGRANRQVGNFAQAMSDIRQARQCAESMGAPKLVAVAKIHESWLVFHKGERQLALQLLDEAELVLRPTGHALSLGNIASARGRFVRSSGELAEALTFFEQAIAIYQRDFPNHPNLGRAFVNAAYVKRLMASQLQPKGNSQPVAAATHARSLEITRQAIALLRSAAAIYSQHPLEVGDVSVMVNMGHLLLERGEIEQAAVEADSALNLGESKQDNVLLARALILKAYVALACSEEEMEAPEGDSHARLAVRYAERALTLATFTQNRRLLAAAHITRGLAAADSFYCDWELAKDQAAKAGQLLGDEERDHLSRELNVLRLKIMRSVNVDEVLRRWSAGELGGKTFQQIEEEFAGIVIPRVWINLGRNVSLVAQELKISPKKVRRILKNGRLRSK